MADQSRALEHIDLEIPLGDDFDDKWFKLSDEHLAAHSGRLLDVHALHQGGLDLTGDEAWSVPIEAAAREARGAIDDRTGGFGYGRTGIRQQRRSRLRRYRGNR